MVWQAPHSSHTPESGGTKITSVTHQSLRLIKVAIFVTQIEVSVHWLTFPIKPGRRNTKSQVWRKGIERVNERTGERDREQVLSKQHLQP
jgi:hypothetical protein